MIDQVDIQAGDERFMRLALSEAEQAWEEEEVPVGAVIVRESRVVGRGYNQRQRLQDPTAHAEILAITAAANGMGSWHLEGCTMYVTLEPCPMCAGALVLSRMDRVVFGAWDPKAGACETLYQITSDERLNHRLAVKGGVLEESCASLLRGFFAEQRAKGKK